MKPLGAGHHHTDYLLHLKLHNQTGDFYNSDKKHLNCGTSQSILGAGTFQDLSPPQWAFSTVVSPLLGRTRLQCCEFLFQL